MNIAFEGGLGDGKGKGGARQVLKAWRKGFDVVSNDYARMPNRAGRGGWHECKVMHVDDLIDASGRPYPGAVFENTVFWVQDAYLELSARAGMMGGGAAKRVMGLAFLAKRFRHLDNWMVWDSQRFADVDVLVRNTTNHRVLCVKGESQFIEVWLDRIRQNVAVETADLSVASHSLLGQLYTSKSKDVQSHLL